MSIPLLFKPHGYYIKRNEKREEFGKYKFVDGGLICNYPIDLFDYAKYKYNGLLPKQENSLIGNNNETLGFQLEEAEENSNDSIDNVFSLSKQIAKIYWESEKLISNRRGIYEGRTIKIDPRGVGLLDFDLNTEKQDELINSGKESVKSFFTAVMLPRQPATDTEEKKPKSPEPKSSYRWWLFGAAFFAVTTGATETYRRNRHNPDNELSFDSEKKATAEKNNQTVRGSKIGGDIKMVTDSECYAEQIIEKTTVGGDVVYEKTTTNKTNRP